MTSSKRAKRDARDRAASTGEPYTLARRRTARGDRYFEDDRCASCLQQLPDDEEGLFCSELCSQTASTIRYWRRVVRDGRAGQPDVRLCDRTRVESDGTWFGDGLWAVGVLVRVVVVVQQD